MTSFLLTHARITRRPNRGVQVHSGRRTVTERPMPVASGRALAGAATAAAPARTPFLTALVRAFSCCGM